MKMYIKWQMSPRDFLSILDIPADNPLQGMLVCFDVSQCLCSLSMPLIYVPYLGLTIFGSLLLLLLILVEAAPPTASGVPLLGEFFTIILIMLQISPT